MDDYTNAMVQGLNARLAYENASRSRNRSGGTAGSRSTALRGYDAPKPRGAIAPDYNVIHAENAMLEAKAAQAEMGVDKTRIDIENNAIKTALDVKKSEAELKDSKVKRTTKALQNFASFAGQFTQKNFRSGREWLYSTEGLNIPKGLIISADEIEKMSAEEAQLNFNKLGELKTPNPKMVDTAIKEHEEELKIKAAEAKAEALVIKQDKEIKTKKKTQTDKNMRADEKSLVSTESKIVGTDDEDNNYATDKSGTAPYVDQYNKLAERLGTGYKYVWDETVEEPGKLYGTNVVPQYVKVKISDETPEIAEIQPPPSLPEDINIDTEENIPVEITTQEDYDMLLSGTIYLENGRQFRKP